MPQPLIAGPRAGLDEALVAESLTLSRGMTVRHGLDVLDLTGQPTDLVLRTTGGAVSWTWRSPELGGQSGEHIAAVRRSATVDVVGQVPPDLTGVRVRVWSEWLLLDGSWARWHLGVFTITNPGAVSTDGVVVTRSLTLADKTHDWLLPIPRPLYVPGTTVAVGWVKEQLTSVFGETSFAVASSDVTIGGGRTLEAETPHLEVFSRVLEAVGLDQLIADEDGRPASQSLAVLAGQGPFATYGPGAGKMRPEASVQPLLPRIPNVVVFSARQGPSLGNENGNGLATRRNASTGPSSIAARGREVVHRVDVDVDSQAALEAHADANAARWLAGGGDTLTAKVALNPRFSDRDVIAVTHPLLGVSGDWNVTGWTYPLRPITDEAAVTMPITAERRVVLS